MTDLLSLQEQLQQRFAEHLVAQQLEHDELTVEINASFIHEFCKTLATDSNFAFEQLIDLTAVDYLVYGEDEWQTDEATGAGFGRGVDCIMPSTDKPRRFAVVYHLLSVSKNYRLRLKVYLEGEPPVIASVTDIWKSSDWYEREAFDMYGILFEGHPDLRRILTDYGFVGHPLRKDFPTSGHVEVRYDAEQGRVVYQPLSIEPRVLVPKVIRHDHRYAGGDAPVAEEQ